MEGVVFSRQQSCIKIFPHLLKDYHLANCYNGHTNYRKCIAALSICAADRRSASSVFTNRTVADSQIISTLLHNGLESFRKLLYYSLSDYDIRTYIKLVF